MENINVLLGVWLVVLGIITPLFVRNRREKLKGLTYKQLVWCCVAMALCGIGVMILHFTTK
jgi:hypothetical protein